MSWNELKIYTTTEGIDVLTGILLDLNIGGFAIEDRNDFSDFLESTTPHWDYVDEELLRLKDTETNVTIYLPKNAQGFETLTVLTEELKSLKEADQEKKLGRLEIVGKEIYEEDWANNWKKYFKPFKVGEKFLIKPSWENLENPEGRAVLEIDPGTAFGTGMHETTSLCIAMLEGVVKPGDTVLDVGTGSGILSIASLLLGAKDAFGCDIDEKSVATAKENAEKNGFAGKFDAVQSDLLKSVTGSYDIVIANIVADIVIELLGEIKPYLKKGGSMVISGIISKRIPDIENAIQENSFSILEKRMKNDWAAFLLRAE